MTVITEETTEEQLRVSAETPSQPPVRVVSGIVDASDGRGYLRTAGYRRSPADIPLTAAVVRQYGLRKGDQVEGTVSPGGDGSATAGTTAGRKASGNGNGNASRARNRPQGGDTTLSGVTAINGLPPDEARHRPHFDDLTPIYPNERFRLEAGDPSPAARIIDLVSPIGKASAASSSRHRRPARPRS